MTNDQKRRLIMKFLVAISVSGNCIVFCTHKNWSVESLREATGWNRARSLNRNE